ncbi:3-keto-disaccharide hydrolase [Planctomicrobium sp. SH668]|uniref:3-keto-disaccharide hydrolase n=1 Tax=Planctomicrobium sp. SH668 TaxID=3448126 RepID=UPI003F5B5150
MKFSLLLATICVFVTSSFAKADDNWIELFDGKTLDGWKVLAGGATYRVEDGCIVGKTDDGPRNTFLTKGPYGDFELGFDVKCDPSLNSGVQIRSQIRPGDVEVPNAERPELNPVMIFGYQCEIADAGSKVSGNFWDEARGGKWWDDFSNRPEAQNAFKNNEWNHYRIVAQGDHIRSWINGIPCADFHDDTDASGIIGLQVHAIAKGTGPFEVRWKNVRLRELKSGDVVK